MGTLKKNRTKKSPSATKKKGAYRHGDLRNVVLSEALRLIEERKQVDFNLRELAKLAGVTHTAVYRHFHSKREILAQIALAGFQRLLFDFQQATLKYRALGKTVGPEQGKIYVRFAVANPGHFRAMFHPLLYPFVEFPELYSTAKATFLELMHAIQYDMDQGRYQKGSATKMATVAWSSVHGLSQLIIDQQLVDSMKPTAVDVDAISEYLVRTIEVGFGRNR